MKALLIFLLIESLSMTFHASAQQPVNPAKTYEIDMYLGVPAETLPEETRKQLNPEEPVLVVAFSTTGGKFHVDNGDTGFEGTISNDENKIRVQINDSRYGTTGCPNINVVVGANEPIVPKACAFSSIVFLYYFRVRVNDTVKAPCDGGVLNALVLTEIKPAYPAEAKQLKAEGNVIACVSMSTETLRGSSLYRELIA